MYPRSTHEKKLWTHEIPTRKNLGPTKYPREKIWDPRDKMWDPRNTHEKKFGTYEIPTKARWHNGTRPTRPTMARKPRNLAHSQKTVQKLKLNISHSALFHTNTKVCLIYFCQDCRYFIYLPNSFCVKSNYLVTFLEETKNTVENAFLQQTLCKTVHYRIFAKYVTHNHVIKRLILPMVPF